MRKPLFTSFLVILAVFFFVSLSHSQRTTIQLTDNDFDDLDPQINDFGRVVWQGWDDEGSDWDIFLYNGFNITNISNNSFNDGAPQINRDGDVVWQGFNGPDAEIFLYDSDTSTIIQLTDNDFDDYDPQINDSGYVAWFGPTGDDAEIYLYKGTLPPERLTTNSYADLGARINDNGDVVWRGCPEDGPDGEIFLYKGTLPAERLTFNDYDDSYQQINNDAHVVWYGLEGLDSEIFLYDGTNIFNISNNSFHDYAPQINDYGYVVWHGCDGSGCEIYLYDGSKTIQFTENDYSNGIPQITNDPNIGWQGSDYLDKEIFLYNGTTTIQLTDNCRDDESLQLNNMKFVVWQGFDGNDYEIFLSRPTADSFPNRWAWTYGGVSRDEARSVRQTADGGYIVAGTTESFGAEGRDIWVMKLDADGNPEWEKTYGGSGSDRAASIQQTDDDGDGHQDDGYIVAGTTQSFGAGNGDIWVFKLDADGNVVWEKRYGGAESDSGVLIQEIKCLGGYFLAGNTRSFGAGEFDIWLLKLDAGGNVVWEKRYGGPYAENVGSIEQTEEGGLIVGGVTYTSYLGNGDFLVLKLDADGGIEWQKAYGLDVAGNENTEGPPHIKQTGDGGYLLAGRSEPVGMNSKAWVLKLDADGGIEWQKNYETIWDYVSSLQLTTDGDYLLAGGLQCDLYAGGRGEVVKLAANGDIEWQKGYGIDLKCDSLSSIQPTADRGFIAVGGTDAFGVGDSDWWVLKLDWFGEIPDCAAISTWSSPAYDTDEDEKDASEPVAATAATVRDTRATVKDTKSLKRDGCTPSPADLIDLPRTGQTESYYAGDDGYFQAGVAWPEPRFTDNGDGTVTDNLTGLMWLQDANCANTIEYDPDGSGNGSMHWESALDFVAGINDEIYDISPCAAYTATHTDWRMPNINEIESLVNLAETDQGTWLNGQEFMNVQSGLGIKYFSSTTATWSGVNIWVVSMDEGKPMSGTKLSNMFVWPVRAGQQDDPDPDYPANVWKTGCTESEYAGDDGYFQMGVAWPEPRFTDNEDGTVTDNLTGLTWLKDVDCLGIPDWQGAHDTVDDFNVDPSSYTCEDYGATIYDDWRLPNRKELYSLIDRSQELPALPSGHPFVDVLQFDDFHTSTTYASGTTRAWWLMAGYGVMSHYMKNQSFNKVWPVRGGAVAAPGIEEITFDECISELCTSAISVSAYDPEGGDLTYDWEPLGGGTIIGTGPEVDFDPPGPSVEPCDPYRVRVTVTSDVSGLSTSETIGISVKLAGDANGDGVVNTRDQKLVRDTFGDSGPPGWADADVNCDGIINTRDKKAVRNQFGQTGCSCP